MSLLLVFARTVTIALADDLASLAMVDATTVNRGSIETWTWTTTPLRDTIRNRIGTMIESISPEDKVGCLALVDALTVVDVRVPSSFVMLGG